MLLSREFVSCYMLACYMYERSANIWWYDIFMLIIKDHQEYHFIFQQLNLQYNINIAYTQIERKVKSDILYIVAIYH